MECLATQQTRSNSTSNTSGADGDSVEAHRDLDQLAVRTSTVPRLSRHLEPIQSGRLFQHDLALSFLVSHIRRSALTKGL